MLRGERIMSKKVITAFLIAAGMTGGLILNSSQLNVKAASKGIVNTTKMTFLYNEQGKLVKDRALAPKTAWVYDQQIQIGDQGSFYRVATHEFVKTSDVSVQHGQAEQGIIRTGSNGALMYGYDAGNYKSTGTKLAARSAWQYSKVDNANGKTWYQVTADGWINSDDASTSNFINNSGVAKISYGPAGGINLWTGYGTHKVATGQKLTNGSEWNFSQKVIDANGDAWYMIGNNQWIEGTYTKITNQVFDTSAAQNWDPNFAVVKVNQKASVYNDSNYKSGVKESSAAGTLLQVASTEQTGNVIWYELSNGGWIPSTVVTEMTNYRSPVTLNGKTKQQTIDAVVSAAKQQLGKPYVWNAKGPSGFDCSGLMQYVFRQATGQNIGSWTVPQETAGTKVSINQLQRGDLVFWGPSGASYHVALYLGNNQYLNALRPGTNVKIDRISSSFKPSFGVRVFK